MSIRISEFIPVNRMQQFHDILKACGGRYCHDPIRMFGGFSVAYSYDDVNAANEHTLRWARITTDVREVRKDQWWRKRFRRLRLLFLCR